MTDEEEEGIPKFKKDIVDAIDIEHRKLIKLWNNKIYISFLMILLPLIIGEIQYYYCQWVLLPAGNIQEFHPEFGEYQPFTMQESAFLQRMMEVMTFLLGIIIFKDYYNSKETVDYWTGSKFVVMNAIGYIPLSAAGLLVLGPRVYQRKFIAPKKSWNYEGISFESLDNIHNFQLMLSLLDRGWLMEREWKAAHKIIDLSKTIESSRDRPMTKEGN